MELGEMIDRLRMSARDLQVSWNWAGFGDKGRIYVANRHKYICTLIFYDDVIVIQEANITVKKDEYESDYYKIEEHINYQIP
jgi:hypothetical protein